MSIQRLCKICGKRITVYSTLQNKCYDCAKSKAKPIRQQGKQHRLWVTFRDKVARPYLDKRYGHVCNERDCKEMVNLDVDHIKNKGSHQELKFDVRNMQYLCRPHHREKTDGKKLRYKHG